MKLTPVQLRSIIKEEAEKLSEAPRRKVDPTSVVVADAIHLLATNYVATVQFEDDLLQMLEDYLRDGTLSPSEVSSVSIGKLNKAPWDKLLAKLKKEFVNTIDVARQRVMYDPDGDKFNEETY